MTGTNLWPLQRDKNRKTYWKRVSSIKLALLLRAMMDDVERLTREPRLHKFSADGQRIAA